jgi:hypothetical protein
LPHCITDSAEGKESFEITGDFNSYGSGGEYFTLSVGINMFLFKGA